MKALTIRNVPEDLAAALERERKARGESLNRTVLALLRQSLGVGERRSNGLRRFAGTWTEEEFQEFERAVADFEEVDEEAWA